MQAATPQILTLESESIEHFSLGLLSRAENLPDP
jgi:hypothetical protein